MKCFTNISIKYLMISERQKVEHYFESGKFNKEICIVVTGQKSKVKSWPSVLLTFEIKNLIFYCQKMKNPTGILVEVFDNWSEDLVDEMREINKISTESVMLVLEDFYGSWDEGRLRCCCCCCCCCCGARWVSAVGAAESWRRDWAWTCWMACCRYVAASSPDTPSNW